MVSISGVQLVAILEATECVPETTIQSIKALAKNSSDEHLFQNIVSQNLLTSQACEQIQNLFFFLSKDFSGKNGASSLHSYRDLQQLPMELKKDIIFARQAITQSLCTIEEANQCFEEQKTLLEKEDRELRIGQIMVKNRIISGDRYVKIQREVENKVSQESIDKAALQDKNIRVAVKNEVIKISKSSIPEYFGSYKILQEVARGGMGVVYKAWDRNLRRLVALKVLKAWENPPLEDIQRFHREARLAASLDHANIVKIYGAGEVDDVHFFTMDFVEGETLSDKLAQGKFSEKEALLIIREIASALQYAHEKKVIHRDVKPGNIMLPTSNRPLLADFGLAKGLNSESLHLTKSGDTIGTPAYMSPEQAKGKKEIDGRSDVYSLGAVLYEMLTGQQPFAGKSVAEVISDVISKEVVPPSQIHGGKPTDAELICLKAMNKDIRLRYQTAAEMMADIDRSLAGEKILARNHFLVQRVRRKLAHHSSLVMFLGMLLLLSATFIGREIWQLQRSNQKIEEALVLLEESRLNEAMNSFFESIGGEGQQKQFIKNAQEQALKHIKKGIQYQTTYEKQRRLLEQRESMLVIKVQNPRNVNQDKTQIIHFLREIKKLKIKNYYNLALANRHFQQALFWMPHNGVAQKFLGKSYLRKFIHPNYYLFSTSHQFQKGLDQNNISLALRKSFKKHGVTLSENSQVELSGADTWWLVNDPSFGKHYLIVAGREELQVYQPKINLAYEIIWNYQLAKHFIGDSKGKELKEQIQLILSEKK